MPVTVTPYLHPGVVVIAVGPSGHIHLSGRNPCTSQYIYCKYRLFPTSAKTMTVNIQCRAGAAVSGLVHGFLTAPMVDLKDSLFHGKTLDPFFDLFPEKGTARLDLFLVDPVKKNIIQIQLFGKLGPIWRVFPKINPLPGKIQKGIKRIIACIAIGHTYIKVFQRKNHIRIQCIHSFVYVSCNARQLLAKSFKLFFDSGTVVFKKHDKPPYDESGFLWPDESEMHWYAGSEIHPGMRHPWKSLFYGKS